MNKYLKEFLIRGFMFSGLGPVVFGVVVLCLSKYGIEMNGIKVFEGIVSTYLLAFIQAGATVIEQVEDWSILKAAFMHMLIIYVSYIFTYITNSWIPYNSKVIVIFSGCVVIGFIVIWLIVFLLSNKTKNLLNNKINN